MKYGLLTNTDAETLDACLAALMRHFSGPLTVVEIGVQEGKTARGIKSTLEAAGRELDYWGFDNQRDMATPAPFDGAILIYGDSAETFSHLTKRCHLLIIDGCHCANHVALDFLNFSPRVEPGGLVLFHDVDVTMQGRPEHYQGHGPRGNPSFSVGVREAIKKLKLEAKGAGWKLLADRADACDFGGYQVYEKSGLVKSATQLFKGVRS